VTSFTRPSPALVLQVTNARVRKPGYEARTAIYVYFEASQLTTGEITRMEYLTSRVEG